MAHTTQPTRSFMSESVKKALLSYRVGANERMV